MIRRPPRSTLSSSSAASDVYKRQDQHAVLNAHGGAFEGMDRFVARKAVAKALDEAGLLVETKDSVSYTHLRAHETKANLVCRLLLEKKKNKKNKN